MARVTGSASSSRPRLMVVLAAIGAIFATVATATAGTTEGPGFEALKPGKFVVHRQRVPIRVVLIGFEQGQVDEQALKSWLPRTYKPVVRYPQFYGLNGRNMGLEYTFTYRIVHKGRHFTDSFFDHLRRIGIEGDLTEYQEAYNLQDRNVLDITGPVLHIDAPAVERWLEKADTDRNERGYTIYFINWCDRTDFRFHVYTRTNDPDPDTKFNFGALDYTAMVAWGGTSSRSWFYDFSAGPEWNSTNWVVDSEDVDGNGFPDYRMPTIWEYSPGGFRAPEALGGDMGLLSRFVAINLLFTSSPLYDPLVTAPEPQGAKVAHIAMFEDDPASSGVGFLDTNYARLRFRRLQPYYRWSIGFEDHDPIDAGSKLSLDIFAGNSTDPGCWQQFGDPFAQLFCYYDQNLASYVPPYRPRDYVGEIFAFNTTTAGLGFQDGLFGFADDNWTDGTQTYSFAFSTDQYQASGFGFTSTVIHEFGHHVGLSHPHDGYDSELDFHYFAFGSFYFAWVGDESDTVMHYIALSNAFGKHNTDNMHRWETAGYLNWANALAGDLVKSPRVSKASAALRRADHAADQALAAFRDWNYLRAVVKAREAYTILAVTADDIGVDSVTLAAARVRLPGDGPAREGCEPRLLKELLKRQR